MKDDRLYLIHIVECIERIESYTQEGRDAFLSNPMVQDAVMRNFEVMGEAAKRVSSDLRARHPEVPWRRVAGFRDVLIHGYMQVELGAVWNAVEASLPALKRLIAGILSADEENRPGGA